MDKDTPSGMKMPGVRERDAGVHKEERASHDPDFINKMKLAKTEQERADVIYEYCDEIESYQKNDDDVAFWLNSPRYKTAEWHDGQKATRDAMEAKTRRSLRIGITKSVEEDFEEDGFNIDARVFNKISWEKLSFIKRQMMYAERHTIYAKNLIYEKEVRKERYANSDVFLAEYPLCVPSKKDLENPKGIRFYSYLWLLVIDGKGSGKWVSRTYRYKDNQWRQL